MRVDVSNRFLTECENLSGRSALVCLEGGGGGVVAAGSSAVEEGRLGGMVAVALGIDAAEEAVWL